MNKKKLVLIIFCLSSSLLRAQQIFTVEDVVHKAQTQSLTFKQTETTRETKYWQYRTFRTNYNPQVQLTDNNGLLYNNSFTPVYQPDGTVKYVGVNQANPGANLALQQPIQFTGGVIAVNSSTNFFKDYTGQAPKQWNGSPVNISLRQPLAAYNSLKWDKKIEPIKYEESKRQYAQDMEQIGHDAVVYFFDVLDAQIDLQIAQFNLAYNDTIYKIEQGRYNIGTTSEDKLLQVELQLLRSRGDVAQAKLRLQNGSLVLRTYIGLMNGEPFQLSLPDNIPIIAVNEEDAIQHAKQTRADYAAFERRKLEAQANTAFVRGGLYTVGLIANYGLNGVYPTFDGVYNHTKNQQFANVTFNVPLLDWGRRRAKMHTARANQKLLEYNIAQDEVSFEQKILTQVRNFEILYLQLEITRKSDEVALKRYVVAQNRYLIGKVDITNLNIALVEKDQAKRAYISALRGFWSAFYDLRKLTLFDWAQNRYLYNPDQPE